MGIRAERAGDHDQVRALNLAAFDGDAEARLVDVLREGAAPLISLVAEEAGEVVGHILFSPATIEGRHDGMGLAPMAVVPGRQGEGIGSRLVEAGLEACRELGARWVVVLGHPEYYPRFGFVPASRFGARAEYEVPDDVFMAQEFVEGALSGGGLIRYHPLFASLEE
jgi:putative acetyltransferase